MKFIFASYCVFLVHKIENSYGQLNAISSVLFPGTAKINANIQKKKEMKKKSLYWLFFFLFIHDIHKKTLEDHPLQLWSEEHLMTRSIGGFSCNCFFICTNTESCFLIPRDNGSSDFISGISIQNMLTLTMINF